MWGVNTWDWAVGRQWKIFEEYGRGNLGKKVCFIFPLVCRFYADNEGSEGSDECIIGN